MFVKIKLEDPVQSKTPLMFSIEDKATIFDLKANLESFVNIPADEQEIQRMDRILVNDDELDKVVLREIDGEKINGAAISLYSNNKFFCFLQFYNKNESDNQSNFFSQPSDAKRLPIDQMPTYIEQLDSDASWQSSSSETDSSYRSRSSSDSSRDSKRSKRKIIRKPDSPTKRIHESSESLPHSETRIPAPAPTPAPTPTVAAAVVSLPAPACAPVPITVAAPSAPHVHISIDKSPKNITVVEVEAPQLIVPSANIAKMDSTRNVVDTPAAPYVVMKPEQRRFAVVIHKDIDEQQPDYGRLIEHFYGLFESSRNCGRLNFSESLSITAHDGQLWVLCEDNETCEWIAEGARILSSYKCSSFIKYFGLLKCRVVLPQVVEKKQLDNVFQLLELQNLGVCTQKWCVVERCMLSPDSEEYAVQAMTTLCRNEVLTLYVDRESKRLIEQQSYKLKYCFWKLTFQF